MKKNMLFIITLFIITGCFNQKSFKVFINGNGGEIMGDNYVLMDEPGILTLDPAKVFGREKSKLFKGWVVQSSGETFSAEKRFSQEETVEATWFDFAWQKSTSLQCNKKTTFFLNPITETTGEIFTMDNLANKFTYTISNEKIVSHYDDGNTAMIFTKTPNGYDLTMPTKGSEIFSCTLTN